MKVLRMFWSSMKLEREYEKLDEEDLKVQEKTEYRQRSTPSAVEQRKFLDDARLSYVLQIR